MRDDDGESATDRPQLPVPLPWQHAMLDSLYTRRARWPHAVLLHGPEGIGKRILAHALARALLCESPRASGAACGDCAGCRYVAAGQHPDLRIVEPVDVDDDEARRVPWIVVDRIRDVNDWAAITSHRGRAKVALVVPAERMNAAAANALLKTLEEPPAGTHFLLVSHQPGRLAATIVSRCQRIAAPRPTPAEASAWLEAQGVRDADTLLAQSGFAPLRALALADADYQAARRTWVDALATPKSLSPTALGARIDAAPRDARRDRLAAAIDWVGDWCADLARVHAGAAPVAHPGRGEALRALATSVAPPPLFGYHRRLLRERTLLSHPLSPRLVAEALLIDYRAVFS
jgi:DNA polymerase-3 subunit delta'